jgi:hypothetical protein
MELTRISGTCPAGDDDEGPPCGSGDCPTIYTAPDGSVVVQGYLVDHKVPDGEGIVRISPEILLEAARALGG